ncbi:hypothetical protein KL905_003271 [Ogataea polymorpha]|uniref:Uncharacterized protein n=1 Tax=Ogataea polymorpha TaxID=460523 RepID=A0A9P8PUH4_9ASCO|nr:hypothetical protein KL937_003091 [Ogataea polymorpha]KAG7888429.1 hypothetical protein KL936_003641 [Ogataea polymorpha]KAG7892394.1 hypothetical protein KL908_003346 [Ogataea polymorpha]KAG7900241.1 hypothetical protein KL935_002984 [Ogataea polymorpha]KAG7902957.1 hypothetical protein KL907_004090 [Ogataea polymorpha]
MTTTTTARPPLASLDNNALSMPNVSGNKHVLSFEGSKEMSPKLQRARMLKLKLQLAYYKVTTNQMDVPLTSLKVPSKERQHGSPISKRRRSNALDDLLASSTPVLNRNRRIGPMRRRGVSFLDDVVKKRATSANLKRASLQYRKVSSLNSVAQTSPSRFVTTSKGASKAKLPPVPRNAIHHSDSTLLDSDSTFMTPIKPPLNTSMTETSKLLSSISRPNQLDLSPTRLMSTPSSIGAARCLLQLAHR